MEQVDKGFQRDIFVPSHPRGLHGLSCTTMGSRIAIEAICSVGHAAQDKGFN